MEAEAKVSEKYQVQIPKRIREKVGIGRGDRLVFKLKGKEMLLRVKRLPKSPVASIDGILEGADLTKLRIRAAQELARHKLGLE